MIKLGGLVTLKPITEAPEDRYVSIGFGKYKEKGKEDDENAPTFEKDGNKFVPISTHKAAAKDSDGGKETPKVNIFDKPKKDKEEPKSDTPKAGTSNYDSEYFADDEKSDSSAYDDDYDDYDDEENIDGVRKTEERLNKIEKALNDTLKLDDKGFTTARSSGGGQGEYEGPLEIYYKNAIGDGGEPKEGAATLSIGSGEQTGNMSIALVDFDGQEIFKGSDYAITGDKELSAEESFKLGKALMKMPEMQKFLKGEISKDEFKPVYDRIQSKFSKGTAVESKSIRLTNILKEADVFTATSKETGTTSVFKSKAARDAAIKAGTHEKRKDDKDGAVQEPGKKDTPKVNIFKKDKEEPKKDEPKSEPKDSSGGRAGNPQVNKAVRKKAEKIGLTPAKLGREEYELRMVQAAHEALTDSNFHSEARKLIAIIEDNPELAKNPNDDPNKPDLGDPGYEEWQKGTAWGSKYGDSTDETDELGQAAAQEAGWAGKDALDGIAFELKMRGFKALAAKIQSVFDDEKNESSMRLTKMEYKRREQ